jgi:pimeloyl-ACP methyl ester carboxylesterase
VVSTFLLEVARLTPHELDMMQAAPSWPGRVATAPTILREIRSLEQRPALSAERLSRLEMPTLLLLGGDSDSLYRKSIETVHALLPNSRIVEMPGQQHVAMNTAPALFLHEVLTFLAEAG